MRQSQLTPPIRRHQEELRIPGNCTYPHSRDIRHGLTGRLIVVRLRWTSLGLSKRIAPQCACQRIEIIDHLPAINTPRELSEWLPSPCDQDDIPVERVLKGGLPQTKSVDAFEVIDERSACFCAIARELSRRWQHERHAAARSQKL
jgi:hypothetical protein